MFESVTRHIFRAPVTTSGAPASLSVDPTRAPTPPPTAEPPPHRQRRKARIGFALGGGAARGWAHIGVLQGLREAGIEADVVAGTSVGALAGGADLAGHLAELEAFARSLTPRRVFSLLDLHFGGGGLISGSRLAKLLDQHLADVKIENLPRPFMAVATELKTGHEIWLSKGNLVDAMRASYALPGIFDPITIGGRRLVDGALVNPVPVSVCRAMGAELVIAVNVGGDGPNHGTVVHAIGAEPVEVAPPREANDLISAAKRTVRKQLFRASDDQPGLTGVMIDSYNIMQDRITRSRLAGDPPDVMIVPKVTRIGLFDFHRADEAIALGREAALKAVAEIRETAAEIVG